MPQQPHVLEIPEDNAIPEVIQQVEEAKTAEMQAMEYFNQFLKTSGSVYTTEESIQQMDKYLFACIPDPENPGKRMRVDARELPRLRGGSGISMHEMDLDFARVLTEALPKVPEGEDSKLTMEIAREYGPGGAGRLRLKEALRDVLTNTKIGELGRLSDGLDSRVALYQSVSDMSGPIAELARLSAPLYDGLNGDARDRVLAQRTLLEIYGEASGEYMAEIGSHLTGMDPEKLRKIMASMHETSREMGRVAESNFMGLANRQEQLMGTIILGGLFPGATILLLAPILIPAMATMGSMVRASLARRESESQVDTLSTIFGHAKANTVTGMHVLAATTGLMAQGIPLETIVGKHLPVISREAESLHRNYMDSITGLYQNTSKFFREPFNPESREGLEILHNAKAIAAGISEHSLKFLRDQVSDFPGAAMVDQAGIMTIDESTMRLSVLLDDRAAAKLDDRARAAAEELVVRTQNEMGPKSVLFGKYSEGRGVIGGRREFLAAYLAKHGQDYSVTGGDSSTSNLHLNAALKALGTGVNREALETGEGGLRSRISAMRRLEFLAMDLTARFLPQDSWALIGGRQDGEDRERVTAEERVNRYSMTAAVGIAQTMDKLERTPKRATGDPIADTAYHGEISASLLKTVLASQGMEILGAYATAEIVLPEDLRRRIGIYNATHEGEEAFNPIRTLSESVLGVVESDKAAMLEHVGRTLGVWKNGESTSEGMKSVLLDIRYPDDTVSREVTLEEFLFGASGIAEGLKTGVYDKNETTGLNRLEERVCLKGDDERVLAADLVQGALLSLANAKADEIYRKNPDPEMAKELLVTSRHLSDSKSVEAITEFQLLHVMESPDIAMEVFSARQADRQDPSSRDDNDTAGRRAMDAIRRDRAEKGDAPARKEKASSMEIPAVFPEIAR